MLYSKIIAVCSAIHTKHINTLCGQNVEFVNVKPGGTYSDQWALNGCSTAVAFLTLKVYVLSSQFMYLFRIIPTIISDYFRTQHYPVGLTMWMNFVLC